MATIQTIATTLTADHRPAVQSLRVFDAEVGKAFTRLDRLNKRALPTFAGGPAGSGGGAFGSDATRGLLELSRGVEDAAVVFGTSGFAGAVRASSNNLSQMAMIMGGPLAGAIAGFAAAGLSIATPYIANLLTAEDATKRLAQETDNAIKKARELFETRSKEAEGAIDFRAERRGLDDPGDAEGAIKRRETELEKLQARMREMDAAIERNNRFRVNELPLNGTAEERAAQIERENKAEEEHSRLMQEKLDLIRKEVDLRVQIGQLRNDEIRLTKEHQELQRQKDAEEFANIIRKFQEEDQRLEEKQRKEREREDERRRNDKIRDNERLEGMLKGRLQGLGGKVDPLDGMEGIPPELRERVGGLLGQIDEFNKRPRAQLAQVVTADSQSMLRAQFQAKEAAERKKEAAKLQKSLEDILRELREARRGLGVAEPGEDVNLT